MRKSTIMKVSTFKPLDNDRDMVNLKNKRRSLAVNWLRGNLRINKKGDIVPKRGKWLLRLLWDTLAPIIEGIITWLLEDFFKSVEEIIID